MDKIKTVHHEAVFSGITMNLERNPKKKIRVAAYCRVSTLAEEQELSYDAQKHYYKTLFENSDKYCLVGVYGDHGITGLQANKRPRFQEMIRDCRKGKIDEIYTKSVSRFSRNFSECLDYARELKRLGVVIHFEKEKFTTADENMEMLFSLMAIVAQEEANSISQSISWAVHQRNKAGDPIMPARYGYIRDKEAVSGIHRWHINEEEAERIRMIYKLFLEKKKYKEIVKAITDFEEKHGITREWTEWKVRSILKSEVYVGDILTTKNYTVDYLTKKIKRNEGEREQQYLKDHHPAIITREQDKKVKEIMNRRKKNGKLGS